MLGPALHSDENVLIYVVNPLVMQIHDNIKRQDVLQCHFSFLVPLSFHIYASVVPRFPPGLGRGEARGDRICCVMNTTRGRAEMKQNKAKKQKIGK